MRIKFAKVATIFIVLINIFIVYITWKLFILDNFTNSTLLAPNYSPTTIKPKDRIQNANKHIRKSITIIFRDFNDFENDLKNSIDSILNLIPNIQILIICDIDPYPPLDFISNSTAYKSNVKFINLSFDIRKTARELQPLSIIRTKYVVFMPDSIRAHNRAIFSRILREVNHNNINNNNNNINNNDHEHEQTIGVETEGENSNNNGKSEKNIKTFLTNKMKNVEKIRNEQILTIGKQIIVVPLTTNSKSLNNCFKINLDFPNWTIEYTVTNKTDTCDMYSQKHAILIETSLLRDMPEPFASPFPEMFFIQAKIAQLKTNLLNSTIQGGKKLFISYHSKQIRNDLRKEQFRAMYHRLQVKKVIKKTYKYEKGINRQAQKNNKHHKVMAKKKQLIPAENPVHLLNTSVQMQTEVFYYGCERQTKSCIGPIYDTKPFYVYLQKHTPPCCLDKLTSVFLHVIEEFENVGIRHWLDNTALRSAIETNSLSPTAYEIDLSFNIFDLERSIPLKKCQSRPHTDSSGFYWIKATDGNYFKVQFSKINQIAVNLLPFDLSHGRVKPSGFYGWKAKEFSVDFLHPMSTVLFLSKNVLCPNNVREFLELKAEK